jgi:uncharacterized protein YbjT (DUF2867 family)
MRQRPPRHEETALSKPSVLVTNANGKIGYQVATQLLNEGFKVRALAGHPGPRSRLLQQQGADLSVGHLEDVAVLDAALQGVQRAYFGAPWSPRAASASVLFAALAQERQLEVVVSLSQWLADPGNPSSHTRDVWLADRVFSWMPGVGSVIVNPGFFADNYMAGLELIAQFGMFLMPLGEGLNAPPSNEDIARVVVGALRNPDPHIGKTYRPTGPALLSPHDMAGTFAKVLQRRVVYKHVPWYLLSKVGKALGLPDFQLEQLRWYVQEYQNNAFGVGAPTDAVERVGGHPPEDFETIVRRYVAGSPFIRRNPLSMARAMMTMTQAMLTPSIDLERFARIHELPRLANGSLAVRSARWLGSHRQSLDVTEELGQPLDRSLV